MLPCHRYWINRECSQAGNDLGSKAGLAAAAVLTCTFLLLLVLNQYHGDWWVKDADKHKPLGSRQTSSQAGSGSGSGCCCGGGKPREERESVGTIGTFTETTESDMFGEPAANGTRLSTFEPAANGTRLPLAEDGARSSEAAWRGQDPSFSDTAV